MKQEDMIKWALIAVGAYLVYQWLSKSNIFGATQQIPAGNQTGAGAGAGAGTNTGAGGSTSNNMSQNNGGSTGGGNVAPEDRELQLMKAAWTAQDAALTGSTKMNLHQWNWYRAKMAATINVPYEQAIDTAFDAVADPNLQYTAAEYHAILNQMGLSGTGWGSPTFSYQGRSWAN